MLYKGTLVGFAVVCAAAAFASAGPVQATPPVFLTVEAAPSAGLADGDVVVLTSTGWPASVALGISMCASEIRSGDDCDFSTASVVTTDATGAFSAEYTVRSSIQTPAGGAITCQSSGCAIGVSNLNGPQTGNVVVEFGTATAGEPSTTTVASATTVPPTTAPTATTAADSTTSPPTTAAESTTTAAAAPTSATPAAEEDDDSSALPWILGAVAVLVVAGAIAGVTFSRRRQ